LIKVDEWGKKFLAYDVKKFDKGFYVLLNYCGEPNLISELRRDFKLDDRILKYQTIKLSDKADPEALKAKTEQGGVKSGDDLERMEEVSRDPEKAMAENQEGKDGIQ